MYKTKFEISSIGQNLYEIYQGGLFIARFTYEADAVFCCEQLNNRNDKDEIKELLRKMEINAPSPKIPLPPSGRASFPKKTGWETTAYWSPSIDPNSTLIKTDEDVDFPLIIEKDSSSEKSS